MTKAELATIDALVDTLSTEYAPPRMRREWLSRVTMSLGVVAFELETGTNESLMEALVDTAALVIHWAAVMRERTHPTQDTNTESHTNDAA